MSEMDLVVLIVGETVVFSAVAKVTLHALCMSTFFLHARGNYMLLLFLEVQELFRSAFQSCNLIGQHTCAVALTTP